MITWEPLREFAFVNPARVHLMRELPYLLLHLPLFPIFAMSLRRKPINFETKFNELTATFDAIFSFSALETKGVSGMNMYQ